MKDTNANSALIASLLASAKHGTFTGLIIKKVGVTRGRGAAKMVFGDDEVHVTMISGFDYPSLVRRSLDILSSVSDSDIVTGLAGKKDKDGNDVTEADVAAARAELVESFEATLAGTNEATTDNVYDPLVVDGEAVKGGRVYKCAGGPDCKCRNCAADEKAPLPGTIYLQGLKVHEAVLTPAPNGPAPKAKSSAKTIAKDALRHRLPVRRYVSYRLEPGGSWILRAGGTATIEATSRGFLVTDDILNLLTA